MLYELQPSVELTGGAWYTDQELDVEFIDTLSNQLYRFIVSKVRFFVLVQFRQKLQRHTSRGRYNNTY